MACTAEEIAEKRRQAQERLKQRKATIQTTTHSTNSTSPSTSSKAAQSFYGTANNEKVNTLNNYENKMKQQSSPIHKNRISSQPYPKRDGSSNSNHTANRMKNNEQKNASIFMQVVTCTCSMISENRFQVIQKGYNAKLIDVFKTISTRSYGKYLGYMIYIFKQ